MKKSESTLKRQPNWLKVQAPLAQWYATGLGQSIAARLELEMSQRLGDVFGYQGLQVGNSVPDIRLLAGAGLQRVIVLDAPTGNGDVFGDVLSLPIASGTMKVVAFFHTLDFCSNPHQALREANRVLTDDGQLIIIGFNPYSTFGLRHLLTAWRHREPWNGRFYARRRVSEWLSVLDYRVLDSSTVYMLPPLNSERIIRRLSGLERLQRFASGVGGLYIMRARKQTIPMSLVRQMGRRRKPLAAGSFARTGDKPDTRPRATVARINRRPR